MFASVAASQPSVSTNAPTVPNCGAEADGRTYVALGAEVFAFPNMPPFAPLQAPKPSFFEFPSGRPVYPALDAGAMPLLARDPDEAEGCRGNPAQRQSITMDPGRVFELRPEDFAIPTQEVNVTLTVRRFPDLGRLLHGSLPHVITPEQAAITERLIRIKHLYYEKQASYCRSAEGQASMHHVKFACFYRPMNQPRNGWIGTYTPLRTSLGKDFEKLSFTCDTSTENARLTKCAIAYTLKPELDFDYTWIDLEYDITLDPPTRGALIDQVTAYDDALRSHFAAAAVVNYPWPANSLSAWKAAQPTEETLRRDSTPILGSRAPN
jgi:hypothetical protein